MDINTLVYYIEIIYFIIVGVVIAKIIYDTRNPIKSLAYILFAVFVPVVGIFVYFSVGVNYRKKKFYKIKSEENSDLINTLKILTEASARQTIEYRPELYNNKHLVRMLLRESSSPLASVSEMKLLLNGEEKFPELIKAMEAAKDHIHIEYFIYMDDEI